MVSTESATTPLIKNVSYKGKYKKVQWHQLVQIIVTDRDIKLREDKRISCIGNNLTAKWL